MIKSPNSKRVKRNRKTISPYKRTKGKEHMCSEHAVVKEGPWRTLETLCLHVCSNILQDNNKAVNTLNCGSLYIFVAESKNVKDMGLSIATKSTAQVAAKMAFLRKNTD
jgi:hypothetical protein